jgi:sulfite reductase alpha subunit-like flavoprotein
MTPEQETPTIGEGRQQSLPSFGGPLQHRHKSIPVSATSHPDDPIPADPQSTPLLTVTPQLRAKYSSMLTPRSSGESLRRSTADDTTDSEAPSTPLTEPQEMSEITDQLNDLPAPNAQRQRKRRASTTFATNSEDIRKLLGNGNGTKCLQKYCCGDGCCMVEALPAPEGKPEHVFIDPPKNEAFRFIGLNLGSLTLDTELNKIVDLPEQKVTFAPIRRQSISEKFPGETEHEHDANAVNVYPPNYMKPHPPYDIFNAPVYGARELTKSGAEKRTYHFDLDVTDYPAEGGVDFKVGGAIGVCPPNDPHMVEDIMDQLGIPRFQRDKPIRLCTTGGRWPTIWAEDQARELVTTRRELLTWTVDISSTPPTKPLFRLLAEYAEAQNEKKILLFLASAQGQAAFCDLRTGPHVTLQQLLHAFPSSKPPLEALCGVMNQLMPRFYSLSNDPHVSSGREGLAGRRLIEIAVTVHETAAFRGGSRSGVGSGFLERVAQKFIAAEEQAARDAEAGGSCPRPGVAGRALNLRVPMFRGLMSNPLSREFASDGPMVLIGAGVGMAPFRGFILNRLKNANCANKIWLIQGIRDSMLDEIYRGELGAHEKEIKKVVQSRGKPPPVTEADPDVVGASTDDDTPVKVPNSAVRKQQKVAKYVQDEVRMQADIVWFVINAVDGRIFVCGSTKGMGEGVESALIDVAMDKGNLDYETAKHFWQGKKEAGQYIAETW